MSGQEQKESTIHAATAWLAEHKLRSVGVLWASGLAASLAYNWSKPHMKTSVKILHARVHAQALTLAALAGAAAVEYYEHKSGDKAKRYEKHF